MILKTRFDVPETGPVYDRLGGHYIERKLWDRRASEGRVAWANHDFEFVSDLIDEDIPPEWGRRGATCRRCGQSALMWRFVDMHTANIGWCVPPKPIRWLLQKWARRKVSNA